MTTDSLDSLLSSKFDKLLLEFDISPFEPERTVHPTPTVLVRRSLVEPIRTVELGVD